MVSIWNFFLIFIFVIASTNADEYCYSLDDKPYAFFGTRTPYNNVRKAQISAPKGCNAVYVWALIRHGSRYANEEEELTSEILKSIRDEIVQNHKKHSRGKLCKDDLEDLQNWKYPWEDKLFGKLMPQGWRDMENIAGNLKLQLPDLLKSPSKDKFKIQSSTKSRCQNSAIGFTNEFYGTTSNDVDDNNIQISNYMLRSQGRKKASEVDELNKFKKSILMDNVLSEISSRLGFAAKLGFDFVQKLYKQCTFEKALNVKSKSAFCAAFTPAHMKVMEFCEDLDTYYTLGYGDAKFKDQACPLALDFYKKLENFQKTPSESGSFYFAHNQILVPFLTKMGLFRDNQPLTSDNYATVGESRLWRTSLMSPFAGNFIAVMYKCTDEMAVSFYVNEELVKYPPCKDGLCSWKTLTDSAVKNEILKDCNEVAESDTSKDVQKKDEKASENTQKKDEKASSDNTQKTDNKDSTNTQDNKDSQETKDLLKKFIKALVNEMERQNANAADSTKVAGKDEKGQETKKSEEGEKKEANSAKDSKGSGAAGLKPMQFQVMCLVVLFTIIYGILGKFI